ncbi:MAG: serine/threonine protein phosphatase PrpC [Myxococcota bacterium]|jgi:serine/threonine protein phosphatase PrpC
MKLDPQLAPRRVGLRVTGMTDVGRRRSANEDAWAVEATEDGGQLLIVSDGMGGMGRGDEASRRAVQVLRDALVSPTDDVHGSLHAALLDADRKVRADLCTASQQPGCTAVVVRMDRGRAHVAWLGDSPVWFVRAGQIIARSHAHRLIDELASAGLLRPRPEHRMMLGAVLSRCLGGRVPSEPDARPSFLETPELRPGDRILLCSDGLTDMVDEATILRLLERDPTTACQVLIDAANGRGGDDNITVVVASCEPAAPDHLGGPWDLGHVPPHPPMPDDPPELPSEVRSVLALLNGRR